MGFPIASSVQASRSNLPGASNALGVPSVPEDPSVRACLQAEVSSTAPLRPQSKGLPQAATPADRRAVRVATVGGVGFAPWAPGTAGALVAVGLFVAGVLVFGAFDSEVAARGMAGGFGLVAVTLFFVGSMASDRAESVFGRVDDGRIVVDELMGQILALLPVLGFLPSLSLFDFSVGVVTAFVAFRGFDIAKPGPVRWAERRFSGGWGVMADDGVAGGLAAVVTAVVLWALTTRTDPSGAAISLAGGLS